MPQKRDNLERPAFVPKNLPDLKSNKENLMKVDKKLEKDIEEELGPDYILDLTKKWLINPGERTDKIPELWNGHNFADFIDPQIMAKLTILEQEEAGREQTGYYDYVPEQEDADMKEIRHMAGRIRIKRVLIKNVASRRKRSTKAKINRIGRTRERTVDRFKSELGDLGIEFSDDEGTHYDEVRRSKSRGFRGVKRKREGSDGTVRSSYKTTPRDRSGVRDDEVRDRLKKRGFNLQKKMGREARKGEGDRHIYDLKPKHLFSGKRKMGKTDRR